MHRAGRVPKGGNPYGKRRVISREVIESEFIEAGFRIEGYFDLLKWYSMWRIYVLRKI
jgi:hypothetical protein